MSSSRRPPPGLVQLLVTLCLALAWLGRQDVVRMEGIVAEVARAMLDGSSWCVPHLHGVPYTYKPPLAYWLVAGSFKLCGENAWTLRLPMALAAVALASGVHLLTRRALGPRRAAWAAIASTTGILFLSKMRTAEFDGLIAAGVGIAGVATAVALASESPRPGAWITAGLGLAFGFLAKGPIAFALFGAGLLGALGATGRWRRLTTPAPLLSLGLAALTALLWLLCLWRIGGEVVLAQPLGEASIRALHWTPRAVGLSAAKPLAAVVLFFPWSVVALLGWRHRRELPEKAQALARAAGGFTVGALLALMLLPTYEPRYFLPLAAPLAVVAGAFIGGVGRRVRLAALFLVAGAWILQVAVIEPHQAARRSLREVARVLAPQLPERETVWTVGEDEHSSLFFYLDRPVRAFPGPAQLPPPGSWLVLATGQGEEAAYARAGIVSLADLQRGHTRYWVARVPPAPFDGGSEARGRAPR